MPGVDATSPADLQGAFFAKQFDLPGVPTGGAIWIAADDYAEVRVNGIVVDSTGSITNYAAAAAAQAALKTMDLGAFLISGMNTIEVKAQNGPSTFTGGRCGPCSYGGNPAGVVFGGTLTFDVATVTNRTTWGGLKSRYRDR